MLQFQEFPTYDALSRHVAEQICRRMSHALLQNDHFVLGLATGSSPVKTYEHLIRMMGEEDLDLSNLYTVNLDEYYGLPNTHPRSYFREMETVFWKPLHKMNNTFSLNHAYILNGQAPHAEKECERFEALIQEIGGVDLQILGLGVNGHIAFNEPGSEPESRTRKIQINEETIQANSRFFNGHEEKVPTEALTMGIGTILDAKEIFLLVHGDSKKEIYKKLKESEKPAKEIPASYLLTHPLASVYSDIS